jgi:putative N6-adenine-specific DNA methylase
LSAPTDQAPSPQRRVFRQPRVERASCAERFFATCPRGLEALLAEDIVAVGGKEAVITPGGVGFAGGWDVCYRVNLESRIATRVLWRVGGGDFRDENGLYTLAKEIAWPSLFKVERSIRVYVTAVRAPFKSLEFVTLKVKDAVCDRFRADCGKRPDVNTAAPDMRIHLFVTDNASGAARRPLAGAPRRVENGSNGSASFSATFYLDTSGEPLWLRGQKIAKVAAPLKENLAAGLLRLAGWTPDQPLLDPMCGSGTILLEAAGMALGDAPGLARDMKDFGFTRIANYQPALWRRLCMEAADRRVAAPARLPIWGSDRDDDAVARAAQNLAHAGLDDLIDLRRGDILEISPPAAAGVLVTNPPYGERLSENSELAAFYPLLGSALKQRFAGWQCWFLSADANLPKGVGLKPARKIPLYNGNLECRFYDFPMVSGQHR